MTDYTKITNYAIKDTLPSGDPAKIIRGTEFNVEFQAIEDAMGTKADAHDGVHTGDTTFENVTVTETFIVNGTTITGDSTFTGDITYSGDNITYSGNTVTVEGDLVVEGDLTVGGTSINSLINAASATERPYRYWKIAEISSSDSNLILSELRLGNKGIDNVQTSATVTVPSGFTDFNLSNINNGTTRDSDYYMVAPAAGDFTGFEIIWDFGVAQAVSDISQYPTEYALTDGGHITAFSAYGSDDGVEWIFIKRFEGLSAELDEYSPRYYLFDIGDAPIDGTIYGRKDAQWVPAGGGSALWAWDTTVKTANFTASTNTWYLVDTGSSTITLTMPSAPVAGDVVGFSFENRNASGSVEVGYNGKKYGGVTYPTATSFFTGDINDANYLTSVGFVYTGEDFGWTTLFVGVNVQPVV